MEKICVRCRKDVSRAARVKDPKGQYFCEPCYAQAKAESEARAGGRNAPPKAPAEEAAVKLADPDELDFAPAPKAAASVDEYDLAPAAAAPKKVEEPKAACGVCKKIVPARMVEFVDGEAICATCRSERAKAGGGTKRVKTFSEREREETGKVPSGFELFMGRPIGVFVTAAVCLIGTYLILLLTLYLTEKDMAGIVLVFAAIGLVVYTLILAGIQLVSMLVVDGIFGGLGFGLVSDVIWKTNAIILAGIVVSMFGQNAEWLDYSLLPVLMLLGFKFVFRLGLVEAIVLSFVNSMLCKFAGILLLTIAMGWFASTRKHSATEDEDRFPQMEHEEEDQEDVKPPATLPKTLPMTNKAPLMTRPATR